MEQMLKGDVAHQEEEMVKSSSWDGKGKVADDMMLANKHEVQQELVVVGSVVVLVVDKTCGAAHLWVLEEVMME